MAVSSWLTFKLREKNTSLDATLDALLRRGWQAHRNGVLVLLPLGDGGDFNWSKQAMDDSEFRKIVQMKIRAGETIGVLLHLGDSEFGANFPFESGSSFQVSLIENRVLLSGDDRRTDVSWYLE